MRKATQRNGKQSGKFSVGHSVGANTQPVSQEYRNRAARESILGRDTKPKQGSYLMGYGYRGKRRTDTEGNWVLVK